MEDRAGSRADQGETRRGGLRLLPSPPGDALVPSVEAPCEGTARSPIVPVSISAGASDLAPEDPIRVPRVAGGGGIRDPLSLPCASALRRTCTGPRRISTSPSVSLGIRARSRPPFTRIPATRSSTPRSAGSRRDAKEVTLLARRASEPRCRRLNPARGRSRSRPSPRENQSHPSLRHGTHRARDDEEIARPPGP